jgi:hypothetical protein
MTARYFEVKDFSSAVEYWPAGVAEPPRMRVNMLQRNVLIADVSLHCTRLFVRNS